ncbi:hypothetical protein [Tessaracoccus flavus]|jgi:hypothetical protein|uniref:Uncharacterized protein n=1 Tax=Tessaracoccus flavus TaxID=1610493 RepID=A0A1Q2CE75_9ACTN|nr:hypothetical protein [Tessaracoccus flavus]AQP44355.1 hypothetical protein RPIT_05615 [Tessaracoccus flavus]SDY66954.1 hypothetical protein SAMN05428934_10370 [Tessaracoccus flavus]
MFDDDVIRVYVPPGWPGVVRPPGSEGWLRSAESFLLDCCPAEYRGYQVLRRHPVVLARLAREFVASQLVATRSGLMGLRAALSGVVDSATVDQAALVLQQEEARLVRVARGVDLVEQALRDVRFTPKL